MIKDNNNQPFYFSYSIVLLPLFFVLAMWLVYWIEIKYSFNFWHYGIYPRKIYGLKGIFFSPFIHGNLTHITNNSLALIVLLPILRFFYRKQTLKVVVIGLFFSGLGTWLIGRSSYHIGASAFIYSLVSFIFFKGIFTKYYRLVAVSLTIVILYGGMLWFMFPNVDNTLSWEGHLSGFIVGLSLALITKTPQFNSLVYDWQQPDFNPQNDVFMKNFDENGNFNPPPKPEEIIKDYFNSSIKVIYEFFGKK